MGCGQSNRTKESGSQQQAKKDGKKHVAEETKDKPKAVESKKPRGKSERKGTGELEITGLESKSIYSLSHSVDISELSINPGQFVLEKTESIYHNYAIKEKIGEGKIASQINTQ